jgi:fatty acid desaturase
VSKKLHKRSDIQGAIQTVGFLGMLLLWFCLALHFNSSNQKLLAGCFTLLYGMQANFLINGMHELGHGSVFRTRWLNSLFLRVLSFLGWLHPDMFFSSHLRHHRYTQNFPHDQENPMPVVLAPMDFVSFGFINVKGCYESIGQAVCVASGVYPTGHLGWLPGWEEVCYPTNNPGARTPAMRWGQFLLFGHGAIACISFVRGWYLVPVLVSLGPFYNGWLFWLCNSTQHIGLPHGNFGTKTVDDFRLNTRTFYLNNPLVQFWYWHMNFHTEHHMFTAVPCYNLASLHEAIKQDLPPTPNGLIEVWKVSRQLKLLYV